MPSETNTPSRRARRSDARLNRERLVAVARDAFTEHGQNASLIDIARRAGVGSGTLYRHFPTRAGLLVEVYKRGIQALAELAERLREKGPPLEALTTWLEAFDEYTTTSRGLK